MNGHCFVAQQLDVERLIALNIEIQSGRSNTPQLSDKMRHTLRQH